MSQKKPFNLFIALLRFWLCLEVVYIHFPIKSEIRGIFSKVLFFSRSEAVPVFFFLAFFFFTNKLNNCTKFSDIKERLKRLILPQIGWAFIYYILYCSIELVFTKKTLPISCFFWQLTTGHSVILNPSMWFQVDLIAITILFAFLFIYLREKVYPILIVLLVISFFIQYLGWNFHLWSAMRDELRYPLGRLIEMLPYACAGILAAHVSNLTQSSFHVIEMLKCFLRNGPIHYRLIMTFFWGGSYFFFKKILSIPTPNGFDYCGLQLFLSSLSLVTFVFMIPDYAFVHNAKVEISCKILTKYTLGIYCAHRLVGKLLTPFFRHLGLNGSLLAVIGIYIGSYFLCLAIDRVFKTKGKYLVI